MVGRLGTRADVLMSESVLGHIIEVIDSMLLEKQLAGILLGGELCTDEEGDYVVIKGSTESDPIGICVGSSEGGTDPTDGDLALFKKNLGKGILMKVDVYAHQFSFYRISDDVEDATVLFVE